MKTKFAIPIISIALVIIAIISAVVAVNLEKNKKICLDETDVTLSNIIVDGNKMKVTITSANSLGMKITDNTYVYEDGKLKFKLYGSKSLEIGKPLTENQVVTLIIEAPANIEEVYFMKLDSKGEEVETEKSFEKGRI